MYFVWNHKETSHLTSDLIEWLVPVLYHIELRNKLCDVNFPIRKTLYCNFVSLKTFSAKIDEISQGK